MYKINYFKKKILSYLNSDKAEEAWKLINKLNDDVDNISDYYITVAEILSEKKFFNESINFYKKSLNFSSNKFNIYKAIAFNYMSLFQYNSALEYFTYAEGLMKDFDDILMYNIGLCLTSLGDIDYAKKYYQKIINNDSKNYLGYIGLSKILKISGHLKDAAEKLLFALKLEPNSIYLLENLGNIYLEMGDSDSAKNCFNKILSFNANNVTAYHQLGVIEFEKNNLENALQFYKKVIKIQPDMYETHQEIGWVYYLMGDIKNALKFLQKSLKINPDNIFAEIDYAAVCFYAGFITKAINIWKKVLKKQPHNVMALNYLKQAERFQKDFGNNLPSMWFEQRNKGGFCHCGSGKRIRDCCLKEVDFSSNLVDLNDFKESLKKKDKGNLKKKKYNHYLINGAELIKMNQPQQAVVELLKAKDIFNDNTKLYYLLAKAYYLLNDYSKTFFMIETGFQFDENDTNLHFLLGDIYQKLSLFDSALIVYKKIINKYINNLTLIELSDLHNNIGTIYFHLNNFNKAKIEWTKSISLNKTNMISKENLKMLKKLQI